MKTIELTNSDANLGDTLALTAILKKYYGHVKVVDLPQTRSLYKIFDGIADVEYTKDHQPDCNITNEFLPKSQKILNYYGVDDVNCIPKIKLTNDEIEWGKEELKSKGIESAIAINFVPKEEGNYRSIPEDIVLNFIDSNYPNKQKLQFGLTKYIKQPNVHCISMLDYEIRQLAALYYNIGHYVGCDTGDYHLMLSVGGECDVIVPESNWPTYHWPLHLYFEKLWKKEKPRVKYYANR